MDNWTVYVLYLVAFFVFLYAWRDATSKAREAREQTNPRASDIARGDRNFAVFAGLYVVLIIFVTANFTPKVKLPNIAMRPSGTIATIGDGSKRDKRVPVRYLIFRRGRVFLEDDSGKRIDPGNDTVRIELPRASTRSS